MAKRSQDDDPGKGRHPALVGRSRSRQTHGVATQTIPPPVGIDVSGVDEHLQPAGEEVAHAVVLVAPAPIESAFADNGFTEQICLLGRGYSKTVMVCVLAGLAQEQDRGTIDAALRDRVEMLNSAVDKHARLGAVIVTKRPWTIENEILTPTLKIRREKVEEKFGERARQLAHEAAEQGKVFVEWAAD